MIGICRSMRTRWNPLPPPTASTAASASSPFSTVTTSECPMRFKMPKATYVSMVHAVAGELGLCWQAAATEAELRCLLKGYLHVDCIVLGKQDAQRRSGVAGGGLAQLIVRCRLFHL